jgi:two-component system cell cycle response regulator
MIEDKTSPAAMADTVTAAPATAGASVVTVRFKPDQTVRLQREDLLPHQTKEKRKGSLVIIAGTPADVGNHAVVGDTVLLGRERGPLALHDGRVSRQHALVQYEKDGYWIKDLGSTNGTWINDDPLLGPYRLMDGDHITVGGTVIKFTLVDCREADYLSQVERLVGTDSLTGLPAKHRFDAALAEAMRVARVTGTGLAVLMMDMDGLKKVNDTYGHHAGATTICHVGKLIGEAVRGRGEACRFGGDEFSAYLPGTHLDGAMSIGEQIRQLVQAAQFSLAEARFRVTISIGAAELPPHIVNPEQLLDLADQALYRAKHSGRNQVSA